MDETEYTLDTKDGHHECPECNGQGSITCAECEGTGNTTHECDRGYEHTEDCSCDDGMVECYNCDGSGEVLDEDQEVDFGL